MEDLLRTVLMEVRNLSYLFFAFGAIWVILFGYLYSLSRRQNGLQNEIERLKAERKEEMEERRQATDAPGQAVRHG